MDFFRKIDGSKYTDPDLPVYPARTLTAHVAMKGAQVGSVVGLFAGTPLVMKFGKQTFRAAWANTMPVAVVLGTGASLGMLYGKYLKGDLSDDGVDDRAYRIHHNKGQRAVDKYSGIGAAAGICTVVFWRSARYAVATSSTFAVAGMLVYLGQKKLSESV